MTTYNVSVTGEISPYAQRESVIQAFAKMAKIDVEKAEAIFSNGPVAIKKGVDEDTAVKFQQALQQIGAIAVIDPPLAEAISLSFDEPESLAADSATPVASSEPTPQPQRQEPDPRGYRFSIEGRPDYAFLTVQVPANETLKVEASSMATMDTHMKMKTKFRGGFSRFLSGESIFINEFTAEGGPGEIGIAPGSPGDMTHLYLDNNIVYLQNSAFVASTMGVAIETKWQGFTKGFFSGESLFLIRASGQGDLWFNTYGALIEIDVEEDYVVDTGNIVAFTDGLDYSITKVGGYKSLFFSGEGFVCRFKGQGKVWIQTRGVSAFAWWAHWYRPVEKSSG
ncbi:TIGR00266 family protein [Ketobacter sp.]|uniref:TIGR00266 family protein n=1 Tax=Ketobacter sp. TaxID=2083498 RepID=UPI0025BB79DC|nr:TIGR00266 family protein [Ketobacter sp.]